MNLGQDSEAKLGQDFKLSRDTVCLRFWSYCLIEILKTENESLSRCMQELVIRTQPSGPLCLWQCFYISSMHFNASFRIKYLLRDIWIIKVGY